MNRMRIAAVLFAMGAASALTGCGDTGGTMNSSTCSNDAQCTGENEVCHTIAKQCVKACTDASGCSSTMATCAVMGTTTTKVCQCTSDAECGGTNVCQSYGVCTAKCTSAASCPNGYSCNTGTGKCAPGGSDAGTDGGMMMSDAGTCTHGSCATGQFCNASGVCEMKACASTNAQPDVCGNGHVCSGSSCADVQKGSCGNFTSGSTPLSWTPASSGPVIYEVTQTTFADDMVFCPSANARKHVKVQVKAYDPSGRLLGEASQPSMVYYRTDGNTLTLTAADNFQGYTSTNSGKNATFSVNLCAPTGVTSLVVGFAYDNGNPVCFTVQ